MPPVIVDKASLRADTATLEGGSVAVQGTVGGAVPTAAQSPSSASEVSRDALREAADAGTRPGGLEARDAPGSKLDPSAREIAVAGKPERPAGRPTDADTPVGRPGDDLTRIDTQAPSREPSSVLPRAERVEIQPGATGAPTGGPTALAQAALAHGPLDALPGRLVTEAASPMPQVHLPMAPQAPAFASALGAQLRMWVRDGVQQAVLQLNPADLGPVAVQIALDGSRAHVDFVAAQAATRSALEASLPTLAAALRDSGLTLAGGGVFDQPRGGRDDSAPQGRRGNDAPGGEVASLAQASPAAVVRARGVVDLVA
jgi:hypothetical protein